MSPVNSHSRGRCNSPVPHQSSSLVLRRSPVLSSAGRWFVAVVSTVIFLQQVTSREISTRDFLLKRILPMKTLLLQLSSETIAWIIYNTGTHKEPWFIEAPPPNVLQFSPGFPAQERTCLKLWLHKPVDTGTNPEPEPVTSPTSCHWEDDACLLPVFRSWKLKLRWALFVWWIWKFSESRTQNSLGSNFTIDRCFS